MKKIIISLWAAVLIVSAGCSGSKEENKVSDEKKDTSVLESGQDSVRQPNKTPITIAMVGDIMMGTTLPSVNLPPNDGQALLKEATPLLQNVDIAAGNLEGSLFDGEGKPKPCYNVATYFAFKMPERYVKNLVNAGFDFVSIANNHINDFGPEAKASTQKVLKEAGIAFAGDVNNSPTAIVEKDGRRIGFVAFGFDDGMPSINNFKQIDSLIKSVRKDCDFVVVSFHGGGEGVNFQHVPHKKEITSKDRGDVEKFAHAAVDAGADVVYGHSPHVVRAAELYKDKIIFYSLGNFCTPYRFNVSGVNGLAPLAEVKLNPDGTFAEGQIHSFIQQSGTGPRKDSSNRAALKMKELTKQDFPSTPLIFSDQGKITRK